MINKYQKGGNVTSKINKGVNKFATLMARLNEQSQALNRQLPVRRMNYYDGTMLLGGLGAGYMSTKNIQSNNIDQETSKSPNPNPNPNPNLNPVQKPDINLDYQKHAYKDNEYDLSRVYLTRDGIYKDANGRYLTRKGKPLIGKVWQKLADAYGKQYANRFSMNTRNGNIFQDNTWRFNDIQSDKEGRTASFDEAMSRIDENAKAANAKKDQFGYYQLNPFNNKTMYLNQSQGDNVKIYNYRQEEKRYNDELKKSNQKNDSNQKIYFTEKSFQDDTKDDTKDDLPSTFGGLIVKKIGDATGLYNISNDQADLIQTPIYAIPYVGSIASLADAGLNLYKGDYSAVATGVIGAIPVVGSMGKIAGTGLKTIGALNKANKVINASDKFVQYSQPLTRYYGLSQIGSSIDSGVRAIPNVQNSQKNIKEAAEALKALKAKGYSEQEIRKIYPDYDTIMKLDDQNFISNFWYALGQDY